MSNQSESLGLLMARHGECVANIEKRIVGHTETPLTPKGIHQAHELGEKVSQIPIDCIISSPLSRAYNTAEIVSKYSNSKEILVSPKLKPQSFGVLEGYTIPEAIKAGLGDYLHKPETDIYTHFVPNGETAKEAQERIVPLYLYLNELAHNKNLNILLILHNSVIRSIIGRVRNLKPEDWVSLTVPNGVILKVIAEQPANFQSMFLHTLSKS